MIPGDLFYTRTHEWVRFEPGDDAVIGITHHAQESLGEINFIELPKVGRKVIASDACAVIESVKAASDIHAPLTGRVTEVNTTLARDPEKINRDPYGEGWLYHLSDCDRSAAENLMTPAQYRQYIAKS
jgi:glycine cleavage system H protein